MRRWITVITFVSLLLASFDISEAKGGRGRGRGSAFRGRARSEAVLGSPVDATGRQAFSSSFPRGNAWGLRGRLDQSVPATRRGRNRSLRDGETIFRGGRTWEFDSTTDTWVSQD